MSRSICAKPSSPKRRPRPGDFECAANRAGADWFQDSSQNYWRVFPFIERSVCFEKAESAKDFYDSAVAFAISRNSCNFPVEILHETIPNFHNTARFCGTFRRQFQRETQARHSACAGRDCLRPRASERDLCTVNLLAEGGAALPGHAQTIPSSTIFSLTADNAQALCIIDLDTVMPGLSLYDFGDSIRFGASTGAEDETDLTKVRAGLTLFEAFTKGYLEGCAGRLTAKEPNCFLWARS